MSARTDYEAHYQAELAERERIQTLPVTKGRIVVEPVQPYCGQCGSAMTFVNGEDWEQAAKEPSGGWLVRAHCGRCDVVAHVLRWKRVVA